MRLGRRAGAAFERLRDTCSRDTVQWADDFAPVHGGGRYIRLDPEHCGLEAVFRVLALYRIPDRPI